MANNNNNYNNNNNGNNNNVQYCQVYNSHDFFTILVQMLLAFFALASLYIKRLQEVPRRTFRTWFLDVSKQGFGACYAHVLNMVIASVISNNTRGSARLNDQCAWYGISYVIDTTLGLVLAILLLQALDNIANERDWAHLMNSGVYTEEDGLKHWFSQVAAWMLILTIVKIIIYFFMWLFSDALAIIGGILFKPLEFNIRFELVFVMILFPGLLNVVYFWIADSFLKAKKEHSEAHENDETGLEDKKEALLEMEQVDGSSACVKPWTIFGMQREEQNPQSSSSISKESPEVVTL